MSNRMTTVVLLIANDLDRSAILNSAPQGICVSSCNSVISLTAAVRPGIDAIIYEPGFGLVNHPHLLRDIELCGIRLLARLRLTATTVSELRAITRRAPRIGVSLRNRTVRDDAIAVYQAISDPDGGPVGFVLDHVCDLLSDDALLFVAASLILGRTRSDGSAYAHACGSASRTCQAALTRLGLPSPHRLLLWGQAFWAVWRMHNWDFTCKQAALAGGFGRASAMSVALRPVLGVAPSQLVRAGAMANLASRFLQELSQRPTSVRRPPLLHVTSGAPFRPGSFE